MTEVERKKKEIEERSSALAVHITLLTIRGQCHRVRPAAPLHFTWLHLAPPLRFSPTCPPPPRFASLPPCSPSRLLTPDVLSPASSSLLPLHRHSRARESPLPHGHPPAVMPLLSSSFSIGGSFRASRPHPPLPLSSCSCSLFLLVRPHRAFSSTVRVRGHGASLRAYHLVSSPSARLFLSLSPPFSAPSSSSLFLSACSPSAASSSFVPLFDSPPFPPLNSSTPSRRSTPCSCARAASYKLFQKFVLLLLSLNHSQRFRARDVHSRPVQCATLFAPCLLRQAVVDSGGATTGRRCLVPLR